MRILAETYWRTFLAGAAGSAVGYLYARWERRRDARPRESIDRGRPPYWRAHRDTGEDPETRTEGGSRGH